MPVKIKRALISVSNKIGIVKFAELLQSLGVEIVSTGGTYSQLAEAGLKIMKVEELTGFGEMLNGRLKTLHPFVHGAILADRSNPEHMKQTDKAGMKLIDMVVVNLYPFKETVSKPGVKLEEAVENIDIGGPTMIRSAAKNRRGVAVVVDPEDYEKISGELKESNGFLSEETLFSLCVKAFQHTCEYDSVIFNYFIERLNKNMSARAEKTGIYVRPYLKVDCTKNENIFVDKSIFNNFKGENDIFNQELKLSFEKIQDLRYGENPHQAAAYYKLKELDFDCFANSTQLQGKELSYNNILDSNAAFAIVKEFEEPCVAVIKHNNPCGASISQTVTQAYNNAHFCDPVSAFGSVIASNYKWTSDAARFMSDKFVEVLIAPDFEEEALQVLKNKENLRVLKVDFDLKQHLERIASPNYKPDYFDIRSVDGGILVQEMDEGLKSSVKFEVVTESKPDKNQVEDLLFAWQVVKNVKSNAIVLASKKITTGIGAGQTSRVDATRIAVEKAGAKATGSVLASDAFFPFGDAIEIAVNSGVTAIIQPGGSVKDNEAIEICNRRKIPMIFTSKRHFKH